MPKPYRVTMLTQDITGYTGGKWRYCVRPAEEYSSSGLQEVVQTKKKRIMQIEVRKLGVRSVWRLGK